MPADYSHYSHYSHYSQHDGVNFTVFVCRILGTYPLWRLPLKNDCFAPGFGTYLCGLKVLAPRPQG
eukprot:4954699-Amphidinium_carterae.1